MPKQETNRTKHGNKLGRQTNMEQLLVDSSLAPTWEGGSLVVVLHVVGEAVHVARGGEDGVEVGEDVVVREGDELAP